MIAGRARRGCWRSAPPGTVASEVVSDVLVDARRRGVDARHQPAEPRGAPHRDAVRRTGDTCDHLDDTPPSRPPPSPSARDCLREGTAWVALRAVPRVRQRRAAATPRPAATPPRTSTTPPTRSWSPPSPARTGAGATSTTSPPEPGPFRPSGRPLHRSPLVAAQADDPHPRIRVVRSTGAPSGRSGGRPARARPRLGACGSRSSAMPASGWSTTARWWSLDPGMFTDPEAVDGADAVVITHEHPDHYLPDHLARTDAPVFTIDGGGGEDPRGRTRRRRAGHRRLARRGVRPRHPGGVRRRAARGDPSRPAAVLQLRLRLHPRRHHGLPPGRRAHRARAAGRRALRPGLRALDARGGGRSTSPAPSGPRATSRSTTASTPRPGSASSTASTACSCRRPRRTPAWPTAPTSTEDARRRAAGAPSPLRAGESAAVVRREHLPDRRYAGWSR